MEKDCGMPSAKSKKVIDEALIETIQTGISSETSTALNRVRITSDTEFNVSDEVETAKSILGIGEIEENAYVENKAVGKYNIIRPIGSGSSSKVYLAYDTEAKVRVSIKIIKRNTDEPNGEETDKRIYREIVISTLLNHPNIVRILDFIYTRTHFFLIFEYIKGSQLYDTVRNNSFIPEPEARKYFRQIISAIDYIHRNCIAHRDLKIENILIDQNDNVKIIDFGLSNFYDNKVLLNTFCGSLYFAAPELLLGQRYCGPEIDVWSLGVVLYVMLCGKVPFDDESVYALQGKIKTARFNFVKPLSAEAQDLILGMLHAGSGRFGIEEIKQSKWLNMGYDNIIHNYMLNRRPIIKIVPECLQALKAALSFQFDDVEVELNSFSELCSERFDSLEGIYWTKRPIVSLYYLLIEDYTVNTSEDGYEESEKQRVTVADCNDIPGILHSFVRFVFSGGHNNLYKRYFIKNIFKRSPQQGVRQREDIPSVWPRVRESYTKGFFKGIKARHIGSPNALKKTLLDIFLHNDVIYEVNEKNYFCTYFVQDDQCQFRISLYYNVLLCEYYINITLITSKKRCFKTISSIIINSLNKRVGHRSA
ncbi:serine/threonine protein kinase KIN1/2 [Pancytospora epiphaga]|nr:serine/threonine protein kinase KIN1/2 [Pancytospora epiphaga]